MGLAPARSFWGHLADAESRSLSQASLYLSLGSGLAVPPGSQRLLPPCPRGVRASGPLVPEEGSTSSI